MKDFNARVNEWMRGVIIELANNEEDHVWINAEEAQFDGKTYVLCFEADLAFGGRGTSFQEWYTTGCDGYSWLTGIEIQQLDLYEVDAEEPIDIEWDYEFLERVP